MGNRHRMDIGQAAARQPGFQGIEPVARGVKSVQAPGVAHAGAQGQGLAAGACAEVHHHFAAFGIHQQGQQLRAFVLHLNGAAREGVQLVEGRFGAHAQAPRGIRRCDCFDGRFRKLFLDLGPLVLERVDAQVQAGRRIQAFNQGPEVVTELGFQRLNQPGRQIVPVQLHQVLRLDLVAAGQPVLLLIVEGAQQEIALCSKPQNSQAPLGRATAVLGQIGIKIFLAQHGVNRFGHGGPLARAQALLTEMARHHHVGGVVETENLLEENGTAVE